MGKNYHKIVNSIKQFQKQTSNKWPEGYNVPIMKPGGSVGWGTLEKVKLTPAQKEKMKNYDSGFYIQLTPEQEEKMRNYDSGFYKTLNK